MEKALSTRPETQVSDASYRGAAQTSEVKQRTIRDIVRTHRELIQGSAGKTDLSNTERVRAVAESYMKNCEINGVIPSITGLSALLGVTRAGIYKHLQEHPNSETSHLIERLRTSWASIRIACAERGATSEAITIFLLKNSALGFVDKLEIEPVQPVSPLDGLNADEARKRLTEAMPDEE